MARPQPLPSLVNYAGVDPSTLRSHKVLQVGSSYEVTIVATVDGPFCFHGNLLEDQKHVLNISECLSRSQKLPLGTQPQVGQKCFVYDHHGICRRGTVLSLQDGNMCTILYTDMGFVATFNVNDMYLLPSIFEKYPSFAYSFYVRGIKYFPPFGELTTLFCKLITQQSGTVKVVIVEPDMVPPSQSQQQQYCCDAFVNNVNLLKLLFDHIRSGIYDYSYYKLALNSEYEILVSYVDTSDTLPWRCFVQIVSEYDKLQKNNCDVETYCQMSTQPEKLKLPNGFPVFAFCKMDNQWYRAKIVQNFGTHAHVLFVDFGCEASVPLHELRLPQDTLVKSLGAQGIPCRLQSADTLENMAQHFAKLVSMKFLKMKVVCVLENTKEYLVRITDTSAPSTQQDLNWTLQMKYHYDQQQVAMSIFQPLDAGQQLTAVATGAAQPISSIMRPGGLGSISAPAFIPADPAAYTCAGGPALERLTPPIQQQHAPVSCLQRIDASEAVYYIDGDDADGATMNYQPDYVQPIQTQDISTSEPKSWTQEPPQCNAESWKTARAKNAQKDYFQIDRPKTVCDENNKWVREKSQKSSQGRINNQNDNNGNFHQDCNNEWNTHKTGAIRKTQIGSGQNKEDHSYELKKTGAADFYPQYDDNRQERNQDFKTGAIKKTQIGSEDRFDAPKKTWANDFQHPQYDGNRQERNQDFKTGAIKKTQIGSEDRFDAPKKTWANDFQHPQNDGNRQERDQNFKTGAIKKTQIASEDRFDAPKKTWANDFQKDHDNRQGQSFNKSETLKYQSDSDSDEKWPEDRQNTSYFDNDISKSKHNPKEDNFKNQTVDVSRSYGTKDKDTAWIQSNDNTKKKESKSWDTTGDDKMSFGSSGDRGGGFNDKTSAPAVTKGTDWAEKKIVSRKYNFLNLPVIPGTSFEGLTVYWIDPSSFFIQPAKNIDDLNQIMELIQEECSAEGAASLTKLTPGESIFAKYSVDDAWYRAKVISSLGDKFSVKFIDYGNTDEVDLIDTRVVSEKFAKLPAQAISCQLRGVTPSEGDTWSKEEIDKFALAIEDKTLQVDIVALNGLRLEQYSVVVRDNENTCVNDLFGATPTSLLPNNTLPDPYLPQNAKVLISWFYTPHNFYITLQEKTADLEELNEEIQYMEYSSAFETVKPTQLVLAPRGEELLRASVLKVKDDKAKISFVDVGLVQIIKMNELLPMPDSVKSVPPFAIACKLSQVEPLSEQWPTNSKEINKIFQSYPSFDLTVVSSADNVWCVELKQPTSGTSLARLLVDAGLARGENGPNGDLNTWTLESEQPDLEVHGDTVGEAKDDTVDGDEILKPGHCCPVYISMSDGYGNAFYVLQCSRDSDLLEMQEKLQTEGLDEMPSCEVTQQNQLYAAKSSADNTWYRALLVTNTSSENKKQVFFVDYGNQESVSEIKQLPQYYQKIPYFVTKCHLPIKPILNQESAEKYDSLLFDDNNIIKARVYSSVDDVLIVDLLINGKSLIEILTVEKHATSRLVTGYLSTFESTSCFYVQLAEQETVLYDIQQKLEEGSFEDLNNPSENSLCIARYPDDDTLYRAKILKILDNGTYEVLFIDYGNMTETSEIKILPNDLMIIEPLALKCSLSRIPPVMTQSELEKLENLSSDGAALYQILMPRNDETIPFKVSLIKDGKDIVNIILEDIEEIQENSEFCDGEPQKSSIIESREKYDNSEGKSKIEKIQENSEICDEPCDSGCEEEEKSEIELSESEIKSENVPEQNSENYDEETEENFIVTHFNALNDFYIQLSSNDEILNYVCLQCENEENVEILSEIEEGMLCLAKYPEDGMIYRAKIIKITDDKNKKEALVFFIDYGNTCTSTEFLKLPENIEHVPPQAYHCKLDIVPKSDFLLKTLADILQDVELIFQTKIIKNNFNVQHSIKATQICKSLCTLLEEDKKELAAEENVSVSEHDGDNLSGTDERDVEHVPVPEQTYDENDHTEQDEPTNEEYFAPIAGQDFENVPVPEQFSDDIDMSSRTEVISTEQDESPNEEYFVPVARQDFENVPVPEQFSDNSDMSSHTEQYVSPNKEHFAPIAGEKFENAPVTEQTYGENDHTEQDEPTNEEYFAPVAGQDFKNVPVPGQFYGESDMSSQPLDIPSDDTFYFDSENVEQENIPSDQTEIKKETFEIYISIVSSDSDSDHTPIHSENHSMTEVDKPISAEPSVSENLSDTKILQDFNVLDYSTSNELKNNNVIEEISEELTGTTSNFEQLDEFSKSDQFELDFSYPMSQSDTNINQVHIVEISENNSEIHETSEENSDHNNTVIEKVHTEEKLEISGQESNSAKTESKIKSSENENLIKVQNESDTEKIQNSDEKQQLKIDDGGDLVAETSENENYLEPQKSSSESDEDSDVSENSSESENDESNSDSSELDYEIEFCDEETVFSSDPDEQSKLLETIVEESENSNNSSNLETVVGVKKIEGQSGETSIIEKKSLTRSETQNFEENKIPENFTEKKSETEENCSNASASSETTTEKMSKIVHQFFDARFTTSTPKPKMNTSQTEFEHKISEELMEASGISLPGSPVPDSPVEKGFCLGSFDNYQLPPTTPIDCTIFNEKTLNLDEVADILLNKENRQVDHTIFDEETLELDENVLNKENYPIKPRDASPEIFQNLTETVEPTDFDQLNTTPVESTSFNNETTENLDLKQVSEFFQNEAAAKFEIFCDTPSVVELLPPSSKSQYENVDLKSKQMFTFSTEETDEFLKSEGLLKTESEENKTRRHSDSSAAYVSVPNTPRENDFDDPTAEFETSKPSLETETQEVFEMLSEIVKTDDGSTEIELMKKLEMLTKIVKTLEINSSILQKQINEVPSEIYSETEFQVDFENAETDGATESIKVPSEISSSETEFQVKFENAETDGATESIEVPSEICSETEFQVKFETDGATENTEVPSEISSVTEFQVEFETDEATALQTEKTPKQDQIQKNAEASGKTETVELTHPESGTESRRNSFVKFIPDSDETN